MNPLNKTTPSFWFGDEPHNFCGFFRTAAQRYCIFVPLLMIWSHTICSANPYIVAGLWFLGAGFLSLHKTVCSSWILISLLPLTFWTFAGLFGYAVPSFDTVHCYFSLYPYCFIFVFAVLLKNRESRYAVISAVSLALLFTFCWAVVFYLHNLYYSETSLKTFIINRKESTLYLFRHSIGCGTAFALWGGLWCCFPYSSRHISWCRKILPKSLLYAMSKASSISLLDLLKIVILPRSGCRCYSLAVLLALLRWSIILGIIIYLFSIGSSRTAQAAVFIGYSVLLLKWNWKKGFLVAVFLLMPFCLLVSTFSNTFDRKITRTYDDITAFLEAVGDREKLQIFSDKNHDRLGIWASVLYDIAEKPLTGHGIGEASRITKERSKMYMLTHSEFIFLAIERGFIALGCFLMWWLVLLIISLKTKNAAGSLGVFLAAVIAVNCLFNNAMQDQAVEMYLLLIAVIAVSNKITAANRTAAAHC